MTLRIVTFDRSHLDLIEIQDAQRAEFEAAKSTVYPGDAWTAFAGDSAICSAGMMELWPGRAYAWALLSKHAGPHMVELVRTTSRMIDATPFRRVEMYVEASFTAGHRMARCLGFVCETPNGMANYLPDGGLAYQYARVK